MKKLMILTCTAFAALLFVFGGTVTVEAANCDRGHTYAQHYALPSGYILYGLHEYVPDGANTTATCTMTYYYGHCYDRCSVCGHVDSDNVHTHLLKVTHSACGQ